MAIQPNFHWQFHEREGSIATDSISGVKAILKPVDDTVFGRHGRIGSAIRLRGLESRVQFGGEVGQFGTSDFTIAFGCNGLIILEGFIAYNPQKLGQLNDQYKYTKTQNNLYDRTATRICQINGR